MARGTVVLGGYILFKRTDRISPTVALYGVFVGLVVTALGAVLFEGLSPEVTYSVSSMPFPRSWYLPLALSVSFLTLVVSLVVGLKQQTKNRASKLRNRVDGLESEVSGLRSELRTERHEFESVRDALEDR